jgi:hypothetical protein
MNFINSNVLVEVDFLFFLEQMVLPFIHSIPAFHYNR